MLTGFISVIHTKDRVTKDGRMDHSEPYRQKVCDMDCLWSGPGESLLEELIWGWRRKAGWTGLGEVMHRARWLEGHVKRRKAWFMPYSGAPPFSYPVCPQAPPRTPTAATFQNRENGCNSIKQGMEKMSP